MEWKQLTGKTLHGNMSFIGDEHVISLLHTSPRIFRFCIVSWKDEREPSIKHCMRTKIDVVQKFTGIQNLGWNWSWANWIRVEYLPRIHHVAAQPQSSRVTVEIGWNTWEFYKTDYLHVDVQRHLMGIKRQQERMRVKCSTRFSFAKKIWSKIMVIPQTWIREKVVLYQCRKSRKWMGQNGREDDVRIRRKRPSSLPCHESIVQRSAQKLSIHYGADLETIYNCSSHTSVKQLSLHGAVAEMCEEYESDHDGTGRQVVGGQSSSSCDQDKRAFE